MGDGVQTQRARQIGCSPSERLGHQRSIVVEPAVASANRWTPKRSKIEEQAPTGRVSSPTDPPQPTTWMKAARARQGAGSAYAIRSEARLGRRDEWCPCGKASGGEPSRSQLRIALDAPHKRQ